MSFVVGGAFATQDNSGVESPAPFPARRPFISAMTIMSSMREQGPFAWRISSWFHFIWKCLCPVIPSAQVIFPGTPPLNPLKLSSYLCDTVTAGKAGAGITGFAVCQHRWRLGALQRRFRADRQQRCAQFGGGVDIKTGIPLLGFRAEVRDFVTGQPDFGTLSVSRRLAQCAGRRGNRISVLKGRIRKIV